ncbi:MAG TPA: DUF6519 domain-containing protein [Myxococcales bacterium]|jgi:hypothetical protein|nr:DUF6519 domain-containing protein [Myxococcales bacterium]
MKGDFSRNSFDARRHFSGVRMQQGRVQLDADWNEQLDIQAHRDRAAAADTIGRAGAPKVGGGFQVILAPDGADLLLLPGRFYLDGLLVELEGAPIAVLSTPAAKQARVPVVAALSLAAGQWLEAAAEGQQARYVKITGVAADGTLTLSSDIAALGAGATLRLLGSYLAQPDLPAPPALSFVDGSLVVYLDVWERHVGGVEDPTILEPALGGPDTTTRTRTVWQAKVLQVAGSVDCGTSIPQLDALTAPSTGMLSARALAADDDSDPCVIPTRAGFRRLENQLYRVEVHEPGNLGAATFKWSRDNGSLAAPWIATAGDVLTLGPVGHDAALDLTPGQWIELSDDSSDLLGSAGTLARMTLVEGSSITIDPATIDGPALATYTGTNAKARRWDSAGELPVDLGDAADDLFLALEDGVQIKFEEGSYRTGDYWTIPARTITTDVEWPKDAAGDPLPRLAEGIKHHYARLAVAFTQTSSGGKSTVLTDCRLPFPPLTAITASDVSVSSTCGLLADAKTVQNAIDLLCEEKDLRFHNKHLHGWGIVCGLEVTCGPDTAQKNGQTFHDRVTVQNGYAIDSSGVDILVDTADAKGNGIGDVVAILDMMRKAGLLADAKNPGQFLDGEVCLTLKGGATAADRYALEPYDPSADKFADIFKDTLWTDFWKDAVQPLVDAFKAEFTAPDGTLVGPTAEHLITFLNLFAQLLFPASGSHIYVSPKEDQILRDFYVRLRGLLQSKTFCAMFDSPRARQMPAYDILNLAAADTKPSTLFTKATHSRLRVNPAGTFGCSTGGGTTINIYDLLYDPPTVAADGTLTFPEAHEKLIAQLDFPTAGASVQDVAFSKDGSKLYALAIQNGKDSLFAIADFSTPSKPVWPGTVSVVCDTPLVTLGYSVKLDKLYAVGRGKGLFFIDPTKIVPNQPNELGADFNAVGHLTILDVAATSYAYLTVAAGTTVSTTYTQIVRQNLNNPADRFVYDLTLNQNNKSGSDDLVVSAGFQGKNPRLYVIGTPGGGQTNKQLLRYDPVATAAGPAAQVLDLGDNSGYRLAVNSLTGRLLLVDIDTSLLKTVSMLDVDILDAYQHPVQIAPSAIAVDQASANVFVLNFLTISHIPAKYLAGAPLATAAVDLGRLSAYRTAVLQAFFDLLGGLLQYLKDAFCDHLLINCPSDEPRTIYLACLMIKDQQIYKICNFSKRKYVHSFPAVEYWMSALPLLPLLKQGVATFCCSVLTPWFSQKQGPDGTGKDLFSASQGVNSVSFFRQQDFKGMLQTNGLDKLSLLSAGMGSWLQSVVSVPHAPAPPAAPPAATSGEIIHQPVEVATGTLQAKQIEVVSTEPFDPSRIGSVVLAPTQLQPGDRVTLLTDSAGRVVGYERAPVSLVSMNQQLTQMKTDANAALAARDAQLLQLKTNLDAMNVAHEQALATRDKQITALATRLDKLNIQPK